MQQKIYDKIYHSLAPQTLEVEDDSYKHRGHQGAPEGGNSHFNVLCVANAFEGQSRIKRQQMIYQLLDDEFNSSLHALSLKCLTPEEYDKN